MSNSSPEYVSLKSVSMNIPKEMKREAFDRAETWPGFPENRISPNPIHVDVADYHPLAQPTIERGQRMRRSAYASLFDYKSW